MSWRVRHGRTTPKTASSKPRSRAPHSRHRNDLGLWHAPDQPGQNMSPMGLVRLMQPFAAPLVHAQAILVGQVQYIHIMCASGLGGSVA